MNIDIRSHIINNFKEDNQDTIKDAIEESIANNDEITLPGMGVFFEILWKNSNDEDKNKMLGILEKNLKPAN